MKNIAKLASILALTLSVNSCTVDDDTELENILEGGSISNQSLVGDYRILDISRDLVDGLLRWTLQVQQGANIEQQFQITYLPPVGQVDVRSRIPVILAPGGGSSFGFHEIGESYDDSVAGKLAQAGYHVFGYSPRFSQIPQGACDSTHDCTAMADWDIASYTDDMEFIRFLTRMASREKPVVGGFSLGGQVGLSAVNRSPSAYQGLLLWESLLYTEDSAQQAVAQPMCESTTQALEAGVYYSTESADLLRTLSQLAQSAPDEASPVPEGAGLTNLQFLQAAITTPRNEFVPNFTWAAGNPFELAVSDVSVVHQVIDSLVPYDDPMVIARDVSCALAGDRTYTSNLDAFEGHVLNIGASGGFGPFMEAQAQALSKADHTTFIDEGHGHSDHLGSSTRNEVLDERLVNWLNELQSN